MRVNLLLCPDDLEKVKTIYTSYLPDPAEFTDLEAKAVIFSLLDMYHAQQIRRRSAAEKERCGCG